MNNNLDKDLIKTANKINKILTKEVLTYFRINVKKEGLNFSIQFLGLRRKILNYMDNENILVSFKDGG